MKFIEGAANLNPIVGTQTFCWPLTPRGGCGTMPTKQWPAGLKSGQRPVRVQRVVRAVGVWVVISSAVGLAASHIIRHWGALGNGP